MKKLARKTLFAVLLMFAMLFQSSLGLCDEPATTQPNTVDILQKQEDLAPPPSKRNYPPYLSVPETDKTLYGILEKAKEAVNLKDYETARSRLKDLVGVCSDQGITSYEALSSALITEGRRLADEDDVAGALLFYDYAITISPNYPPAYFARGWALLNQNKLKLLVASDSFIEGISRSTRDFWWSYNYLGNKATSVLFALAALFTLFGLFVAIRYTPLIAHDISEKLGKLELEAMLKYAAIPAFFVVVLLLLGYWWAVTIVLLGLWFYLNRREKTLAVLFFLLLVFMPNIMERYASFVQGGGNKTLWVMDKVNKGRMEVGTEAYLNAVLEKDPENKLAMMSLAQTYEKKHVFDSSIDLYEKLVSADPQSAIYRNNLGNAYFLTGDMDKAVKEYKAAIEYSPNSVLPHFNLSQAYGELLMFTERADEDREASRLDPDLVATFRAREGDTPLRMVYDEKIPIGKFWDIAFKTTSESKMLASSLWSTTIKVMPLDGATYAGIGFIVLVIALNMFKRNRYFAHFCEKCGKVSCKKCQKPVFSKDLCSQCHQIFVKLEGVEAKDRLKKTLEIREKETRDGMLYRISSLFLPGSGHYLMGRPMRGFIFSGIFILLIKDVFFGRFLEVPYAYSLNVIGPDTVLQVFLLAVFYFLTQIDIYRITRK
jgi:tetratricopeptide (TPR) repeat protein